MGRRHRPSASTLSVETEWADDTAMENPLRVSSASPQNTRADGPARTSTSANPFSYQTADTPTDGEKASVLRDRNAGSVEIKFKREGAELHVTVIQAEGLPGLDQFGENDVFTSVSIADTSRRTATVADGGAEPVWGTGGEGELLVFNLPDGFDLAVQCPSYMPLCLTLFPEWLKLDVSAGSPRSR